MTNVTDFDITMADNASNVSDIITKQKDGTASQCEKQLPYLILCLPNTEIIHQHGVSETPNKMKIDCYFFFLLQLSYLPFHFIQPHSQTLQNTTLLSLLHNTELKKN